MSDNKIQIRLATISDCKSLFDWRTDEISKAMFFNESSPSIEEHNSWFEKSLSNANRTMYIGELGDEKIGMCRFDFEQSKLCAEVSINMNPACRGRGLGKKLLFESTECYFVKNKHSLLAKVKPNNLASLKIFDYAGFKSFGSNQIQISLRKDYKEISFKEVCEEDAATLLKLLGKRSHSISHHKLPTKNEHLVFLKTKPYRYWAIVLEDDCPVGTFYIQKNNSIGLNLLQPSKEMVYRILHEIQTNFEPLKEVKSKVPSHFYINSSYSNKELREILVELDAIPIQVSYKI